MLGRGVGLIELVEAPLEGNCPEPALASAVCRFVWCGQMRMAGMLAFPDEGPWPQSLENQELYDDLARSPRWVMFAEAVHLADLIDNFLATLESDRRLAGLAHECRSELDLLLVLADLCEDSGLPRAREEARYLHALAESFSWDLWAARINGDHWLLPESNAEME